MFQMKVGLELPNLVKKFQSVLKMKDRLNFHEVECNLPPPPPPHHHNPSIARPPRVYVALKGNRKRYFLCSDYFFQKRVNFEKKLIILQTNL